MLCGCLWISLTKRRYDEEFTQLRRHGPSLYQLAAVLVYGRMFLHKAGARMMLTVLSPALRKVKSGMVTASIVTDRDLPLTITTASYSIPCMWSVWKSYEQWKNKIWNAPDYQRAQKRMYSVRRFSFHLLGAFPYSGVPLPTTPVPSTIGFGFGMAWMVAKKLSNLTGTCCHDSCHQPYVR